MKQSFLSILIFSICFFSAIAQELSDGKLTKLIKKSIKPQYTEWVLFSNGTYQVITADSFTNNLGGKATQTLRKLINLDGKILDKNTSILKTDSSHGWFVDSIIEGLYTYIDSTEFKSKGLERPTKNDIINRAVQKRQHDKSHTKILFRSH
jgi:hypothetical protein